MSDNSEMYDRHDQARAPLNTSRMGTGEVRYLNGSIRGIDLAYLYLNTVESDEMMKRLIAERDDELRATDLSDVGIFELTALPATEASLQDLDGLQERLTQPERPNTGRYAGSRSKRILRT